MNLGSELPVDGNSLEQFSQSFLLKGRQRPARHLLMFARDFGNSGQSFFPLGGKMNFKNAAVTRAHSALHEFRALHCIDHGEETTGIHAKKLSEPLLTNSVCPSKNA
jgi:hypothetical protein